MTDNTRTRIFLEANNLAKHQYGVNYSELSAPVQETLWCIAKRIINAQIQDEINSVGGKRCGSVKGANSG